MPKRRERVAPPPAAQGWDFRYATNDAARGWTQTCATAPGNARAAWEAITSDPRRHSRHQHPLKGPTSQRSLAGVEMDQWQYEVPVVIMPPRPNAVNLSSVHQRLSFGLQSVCAAGARRQREERP